ncbi:succinyldiaminopimelate transaminase [Helicobacter himalayensis]|uniref:succinyldiaminopimelate transaminase n=1 Tax=Helicobacter himalayensis TaxID=1591088 RepID=UPI000836EB77|nr:succinyldiaminopimelate transaminase [Helicobacter himalayensis]
MLTQFQSYPFQKLSALLEGLDAPQGKLYLSIGEPQFPTPQNILDSLTQNASLLNKYPKSNGEDFLRTAQLGFIKERFALELESTQILPTFGTREVLFNFPQFYLFGKSMPTIAYPNPFYQIYEGAAIASNARIVLMELRKQNAFKPTLTKAQLQEVDLVILNSPNNPTGATLSLDELAEWVRLAQEYNFVILSDECYSEIYAKEPPASILQACIKAGNHSFSQILALNSISKRSNAPGLRSGFIAGDAQILKAYSLYRTYVGCANPLPLQKAAAIAWQDFSAPEHSRAIYAQNLSLAQEFFPQAQIAPYSFYLWLEVGEDTEFCKYLYTQEGVVVLPGSFLGRNDAGKGFVRIALVYESAIIKDALKRIKSALARFEGTQ